MSRLALMTDYSLRMEVEALRLDLNVHYLELGFGRGSHQQQEMYLWKKVRLEALEMFANAHRAISQIDPRAIHNNYTRQRYGPSTRHRHNPYKREQKTSAITMRKESNRTKKIAIMDVKVEPNDDDRAAQSASEPLALLPVKLEDIKEEKE